MRVASIALCPPHRHSVDDHHPLAEGAVEVSPLQALGRVLVISPHLDDAVFSCGSLIAGCPGTRVLTVFAGDQPADQPLTDWDRGCGFSPGDAVMRHRRAEDAAALALLRATPVWLGLLDAQYAPSPSVDDIACVLRDEIDRIRPETVLFPLGLFHTDHEVVHQALLRCVARGRYAAYAYEDALYRRLDERLSERLFALRRDGWRVNKQRWPEAPGTVELKRMAVCCYRSQLKGLTTPGRPGLGDIAQPEAFWHVRREAQMEKHGSRVRHRLDA